MDNGDGNGRHYPDPSTYPQYYHPGTQQQPYHSPHNTYASASSASTGTGTGTGYRPSPPPTPQDAMAMRPPGESSRGLYDTVGMYESHAQSEASSSRRPTPPPAPDAVIAPPPKRVGGKANVSSACAPCKKAHLACDIMRPCKRCVTMGKEEMCEDVPHKKRGRPKVNKPPGSAPYQRARHGNSHNNPSPQYRPPLPPPFPPPPPLGSLSPGYNSSYGAPPPPPGAEYALPPPGALVHQADPPDLFTLFTTTDLRIMRATQGVTNLIGYHPSDFANMSLLDWVHPSDRHLLDTERSRLLELPPHVGGTLSSSSRDMHLAIHQRSDRELLSPAEGMKDPYPNQNVRLVRSDQQYSLFNIRLHLGGGLGASIFRPDTHDRVYLVVSCLLVPNQHPAPPPLQTRAPSAATTASASSYGPPTPITPLAVGPQGGLPSFSSIAAGVDAPPPQGSLPMRYGATPYSSRPGTGSTSSIHQQQQQQQQHQSYYARPPSTPSSAMYTGTKQPSPQYRPENTRPSSYAPYDYPPPAQNVYGTREYRQDEWRRLPGDDTATATPTQNQHSNQNGSQHGSLSSLQTPSSAAPTDYSRRPWET